MAGRVPERYTLVTRLSYNRHTMVIHSQKELEKIAKDILDLHPGILALEGPLGAGKTTLTKVIAKQLGVSDEVTSPTFVLHSTYELSTINYKLLHHIDCWRMEDFSELLNIGLTDIINPKSLVIIEWADKFKFEIRNLKFENKIVWVKLDYTDNKNERLISFQSITDSLRYPS